MTWRISYWLEKEVKIVWPWTAPHFPPLPEIFDRWNGGTRALSDYNTAAATAADSRANWHHLRNSVDNAPPNDRSRLLPFQPKDIFTPSANPQCSSLMRAKTPHLSEWLLVNKYQLVVTDQLYTRFLSTGSFLSTLQLQTKIQTWIRGFRNPKIPCSWPERACIWCQVPFRFLNFLI